MKSLIALALLQTGILLFLLFEFSFDDGDSPIDARTALAMAGHALTPTSSRHYFDDGAAYSDEERLRRIIREELAAIAEAPPTKPEAANETLPTEPESYAQGWAQWDSVAQQIDYHTSVGRISTMEMQKLQGEIAKLDKTQQREMLSRLTRALSSGQLEGHL